MKRLLAIFWCIALLSACGGSTSQQTTSTRLLASANAAAADYATVVQQLYVAYFGRPADPAGLASFQSSLNAAGAPTDIQGLTAAYGTTPAIRSLIDAFGNSTESKSLYTGNTQAFVTAIFQNVLNRAPAAAGLQYWTDAIDNRGLSRGNAALAIMNGALSNNTAQGLIDAATVNNKIAVAATFTASLNTTAEIDAYKGATAAATARTALAAVDSTTNTTTYQVNVDAAIGALLYNLPVTTITPDIKRVFGQVDLKQTTYNEATASRVFHPGGVYVDRAASPATPSKMYIWDSGNNRIVGFSSIGSCTGGTVAAGTACTEHTNCGTGGTCNINANPQASFALGQPGTEGYGSCNGDNTSEAAATAGTVCFIPYPNQPSPLEGPRGGQMVTDSAHNLYIVDTFNNRILRYDNPFAVGEDLAADAVWGQASFNERTCNRGGSPTASTLCTGEVYPADGGYIRYFTSSLDVSQDGGTIWVADPGNHRVLKVDPGVSQAKLVLGQTGFTSKSDQCDWSRRSLSTLCIPTGIAYDWASSILYVLDGFPDGTGRILVFNSPSANGQAANAEWLAPAGTSFNWPRGLTMGPGTHSVWVNDTDNNRSLRYTNGVADRVIGLCDFTLESDTCTSSNDFRIYGPHASIGFDQSGNLYLPDLWRERVSRFASGGTGNGTPASSTGLLFDQSGRNDHYHANRVSAASLANPGYVAFIENQLVVADRRRLLFWNNYSTGTLAGGSANGVLGEDDFNSQVPNSINEGVDFTALAYDRTRHLLYAARGNRAIYWDITGGLTDRAQPAGTIDLLNLPLEGGGTLPCTAVVSGANVQCAFPHISVNTQTDSAWLVDSGFHRVIRIRNVSSSSRKVDLVIGQSTVSAAGCNRGAGPWWAQGGAVAANGFCDPAQVELDTSGNLFVVDGTWECRDGNCRVVQYAAADIPAPSASLKFISANPVRVFGPSSFTSRDCTPDTEHLCSPRWIGFDPTDGSMFATGDAYSNPERNRRLAYWRAPIATGVTYSRISGFVDLPMNQAGNVAIDSNGYVAVLDHTWNRVVLFKKTY